MALAETINQLEKLFASLTKDMGKVHRGNKAASQRVRTGTIKLEKIAKAFRKESVLAERTVKLKKKKVKKKKR